MKWICAIMAAAAVCAAQDNRREKSAAEVQKTISKIASTKVEKPGGLKNLLMAVYKDNEDYLEVIKENPENELEELLGLNDLEMAKGVISHYLQKYEETLRIGIPFNPMTVSKFLSIVDKCSNLAELMTALNAPDKIWVAEFQYGQVQIKSESNPLVALKEKAVKESDALYKELKEAFTTYVKLHCSEKVDDVLAMMDEEIEVLMARRKMKKTELKEHIERDFREEPYSLFQANEYLHLGLTTVVKAADMPKNLWEGMPPDMKWERFKDGDYLVAAPCAIGMIDDQSLGSYIFMVVMRKINGKWMVVGE